ncbi:MAG TPA: rhodanese-like domain-containing protein [Stellaceae bacterium]|nr:rhodanese-like domain-containing protein [Stellaceae bacterium]
MSGATYAGDLTPKQVWERLAAEKDAVLVDVRTVPEWNFVGLPDLAGLGKKAVCISWQVYPAKGVNGQFAEDLAAAGVAKDQPVFLLCRSGGRSRAAAELLTAKGYTHAYNIIDGFEGNHDAQKHRGTSGGWKVAGLPWQQG